MGSKSSKNTNTNMDSYIHKDLYHFIGNKLTPEQIADLIINIYNNSNTKYKDINITIFNKSLSDLINIQNSEYLKDLANYNIYKRNNILVAVFLKDIIYIINKYDCNNKKFNNQLGGYFLAKLRIPKIICELIDSHQLILSDEKYIHLNKDLPYYNDLILLRQSNSYENINNISQQDINKHILNIKILITNCILI
jgi:hypothetical protein